MEKEQKPSGKSSAQSPLTGGLPLDEERLKVVLPQWQASHRTIRLMDSIELGETEPATVYVWEERP
jgi:hypothetical protein